MTQNEATAASAKKFFIMLFEVLSSVNLKPFRGNLSSVRERSIHYVLSEGYMSINNNESQVEKKATNSFKEQICFKHKGKQSISTSVLS